MDVQPEIRRLGVGDLTPAMASVGLFIARPPSEAQVQTFLANEANVLVTATAAGEPVGQAIGYVLQRLDGAKPMLFLYAIIVAEDYRGQGIGSAMIAFLEELAKTQGCEFLFAHTNARNACAMRLYQGTHGQRPHIEDALFVYEFGDEGLITGPPA